MNFSLHLSDDLVRRLNAVVQATGRSRNALIRQAIEAWLEHQEHRCWPEEVLTFQGIPETVPFEQARTELLPPKEPFDAVSA
jgi:Arc/MetJ-type ribon-helix-helix transcriptional regulator